MHVKFYTKEFVGRSGCSFREMETCSEKFNFSPNTFVDEFPNGKCWIAIEYNDNREGCISDEWIMFSSSYYLFMCTSQYRVFVRVVSTNQPLRNTPFLPAE